MSRRPTTTSSAPPRVRHVAAIDHDTNAVLHCLRLVVRSQEFVKMAVRRFVHRSKVVQRFARRIVRGRQALTAAALDALGHEEATVNPGELRALWGASGCGTPSHEVRLLTIVSMYHKQRAAFRARWRAWREATEAAAERLRCEEARMRVRRRRDGGGGEQQQQRCSLEAARYDLVQPLRQRLAQVRGLRPHFALEATLAQVLAEHTSLQRRKLVTAVLQTMRGLNLEATDPHVVATLLRRYEKEADAAEEAAAAADAAVAPAGTGDAAAFFDDDDARAEEQLPATSGSGLRFDRSLGSASALHPAALGASITVGTTASASGVGVGCAPVFHTAKEEDTRRVFGVYALSPDDTRPTPAVPAVGAAVVAPTVPSPSPPTGGFCLPLRLVEKGCWGWAADAPSSAAAAAAAASTAARPSSSAAGSATAAARRRLRRLRRAPPRRVVKETRAMRVRRVKEAAAAAVGAASDKSKAEQRAAAEEEEEVEEEAQAATSAYLPDNRLCAVLLESTAKAGRHRKDKVVYTQAALRTSPQPPTPTPPPPAAASDAAASASASASASAPAPSPLHLTREALLCSARARRYACNMTRRCAAFGADACGVSPAEQNALAAVVAAAVPAAAAAAAAAAETLSAATAADAAAASEPPQQALSSSSSPEEGAGGGGGGGCGAGAAEYRPLEAAEVRRRLADGVCLAATLDDVEFMSAVDALVGAEERQRARRCLERSGGGGGGGDGSDDASEAQDLRVNPYFACPASGRSAAARAAAAAAAAAESRRRRRRETAGMEHTVCLNKAHYARAAFMWERRKKKKAAAAAAATKSGRPQSAAAAPRPPPPPEAATAGGSWGHSCSPWPAGMAKRRMRAAQRILSPRAPVVLTPDGSSYHYHRFYDAEAREQPWGKRLR